MPPNRILHSRHELKFDSFLQDPSFSLLVGIVGNVCFVVWYAGSDMTKLSSVVTLAFS